MGYLTFGQNNTVDRIRNFTNEENLPAYYYCTAVFTCKTSENKFLEDHGRSELLQQKKRHRICGEFLGYFLQTLCWRNPFYTGYHKKMGQKKNQLL